MADLDQLEGALNEIDRTLAELELTPLELTPLELTPQAPPMTWRSESPGLAR